MIKSLPKGQYYILPTEDIVQNKNKVVVSEVDEREIKFNMNIYTENIKLKEVLSGERKFVPGTMDTETDYGVIKGENS